VETVGEFLIAEREFSDDESKLSIGLANIHAEVPGIEANKDKILRAATTFKERGVNFAIFPEFCLSGYFWDQRGDCHAYMQEACTENHADWIENELKSLLDDQFRGVVLNNLRRAPGDRFYNTTFVVAGDRDYLAEENAYDKVFLPGAEKDYTESGRDDRLVVESQFGRFGFTTTRAVPRKSFVTITSAPLAGSTKRWRRAAEQCSIRLITETCGAEALTGASRGGAGLGRLCEPPESPALSSTRRAASQAREP